MQQQKQFKKSVRSLAAGKGRQFCASLLLLTAATVAQADDQHAPEPDTFVVIHERPKPVRHDPLVFVRKDLGRHNYSDTLFSVRADYQEFAFNDNFTRRQEPCVVGVRASFTF